MAKQSVVEISSSFIAMARSIRATNLHIKYSLLEYCLSRLPESKHYDYILTRDGIYRVGIEEEHECCLKSKNNSIKFTYLNELEAFLQNGFEERWATMEVVYEELGYRSLYLVEIPDRSREMRWTHGDGFHKWICVEYREYTKRGGGWGCNAKFPLCPHCGKAMKHKGTDFRVPKKNDDTKWKALAV